MPASFIARAFPASLLMCLPHEISHDLQNHTKTNIQTVSDAFRSITS